MIGWYVHHVGRGHLHHALAITGHLAEPVTAFSSLDRPDEWRGDWVKLARDDDGPIHDPQAHGVLHWAPLRHAGLSTRMASVAQWIAAVQPRAFVVDVSAEVTVLARLLGVPVVTFCLPGVRTDAAHSLAWDLSDAIIAPWPRQHPQLCVGLGANRDKVRFTGGISRFDGRLLASQRRARHGVVLGGLGGAIVTAPDVPGWTWTVLDGRIWCDDVLPELAAASVVVTHAGLGAIADVAAARVPAVVVAQARPFAEQSATAAALDADGLAVIADPDTADWPRLIGRALSIGGAGWTRWSDGLSAGRAAARVTAVADLDREPCAS